MATFSPIPAPPLPSLGVVLPCRNEEGNVERTIRESLALAPHCGRLEVVVVDDGSTDGTRRLAETMARADQRVRVVHNPISLGYGGAVRRGFEATTAEWVFLTDGDGQFDLGQVGTFLANAGSSGCAAAIGFRLSRAEGTRRALNAWLWGRLVGLVFGFRYRDVDCAFKLLPGGFARSPGGRAWVSSGALISAEMLARADRAGLTVVELPVEHRPRLAGAAGGASLRVIFRAFAELLSLAGTIREGR